jgi:glycosyltransferase involved in cell wall biosynthesis
MKLLFVADGRSPIALNWIAGFIEQGDEVHLVSTFLCESELKLASLSINPIAFSRARIKPAGQKSLVGGRSRLAGSEGIQLRTQLRHWLGPLTIPSSGKQLQRLVREIQPDLVHALRIPYEGMLAASALAALPEVPLIVSVWGNDFTLHAQATPLMSRYTLRTLRRADALHTDCQRDLRLARQLGFPSNKPVMVLPGNGGIRLDVFHPPGPFREGQNSVINPRGFRAYVRNEVFFRSAAMVLSAQPGVKFYCPAMQDEPQAHRWLHEFGISGNVELLPNLTREQMADLFRSAQVAVSPSTHDGTPNTLLEAMACGCFPIAGDIESLHEWITPGLNGLLVNLDDPRALSEATLIALRSPELRAQAGQHNWQLVTERAEYRMVMREARQLYQKVIG